MNETRNQELATFSPAITHTAISTKSTSTHFTFPLSTFHFSYFLGSYSTDYHLPFRLNLHSPLLQPAICQYLPQYISSQIILYLLPHPRFLICSLSIPQISQYPETVITHPPSSITSPHAKAKSYTQTLH